MLVRALRTTHGSYGTLPRGTVADVPEYEARDLISYGYAIEELPLAKQEAAPIVADNDNSPLDPAGCLTGADAPQLSSQVGQAPRTLTSPSVEVAQNTSPSITDTDSPRGQTSSMPATTTGGKRKRGRPRLKD